MMGWWFEWGDKVQFLHDLAADGGPVPGALRRRPDLYADLTHVWAAWMFLHSQRPVGFAGPSPIRFTDVVTYCDEFGMEDAGMREDVVFGTQWLDREFLRLWYDRQKRRRGADGNR